jgi:16S rRNA processing protein RimM
MLSKTLVSIGIVTGVFGIRGELKVDSLTDYDDRFDIDNEIYLGSQKVIIQSSRRLNKSRFIIGVSSIDNRTLAMAIPSGTLLGIDENQLKELPEGKHYRFELIDFDVLSTDGERIGRVSEIIETGANDVFVVKTKDDLEILIPNAPEMVKIDSSSQTILVDMLKEV